MKRLLFNIPRPSVPIFERRLRSGTTATASSNASDDASVWIASLSEFPIRRIYCVGRNYREHAVEMGGDPNRESPFFFQKPPDSAVVCYTSSDQAAPVSIPYPQMTSSLHYEGELIVAIGKEGCDISLEDAMDHVYGYSLGCDLTRRDLQVVAKSSGRPWDAAKGFDKSCPISPIIPKDELGKMTGGLELIVKVNDSTRQKSAISNMIYSIPEIISHLSRLFRISAGDLILTGTPAGVSNLNVGDTVSISCGPLLPCEFIVGPTEL